MTGMLEIMNNIQQEAYYEGVRAKFEGAGIHQCCFQSTETESIKYWKKGWNDQASAEAKNESLY